VGVGGEGDRVDGCGGRLEDGGVWFVGVKGCEAGGRRRRGRVGGCEGG
jgi:hypothetical protein